MGYVGWSCTQMWTDLAPMIKMWVVFAHMCELILHTWMLLSDLSPMCGMWADLVPMYGMLKKAFRPNKSERCVGRVRTGLKST